MISHEFKRMAITSDVADFSGARVCTQPHIAFVYRKADYIYLVSYYNMYVIYNVYLSFSSSILEISVVGMWNASNQDTCLRLVAVGFPHR